MNDSPKPESNKRLIASIAVAATAGVLLLVTIVLPAEYGVDPLGVGGLLGLNAMNAEPTRTIEITDIIGGNAVSYTHLTLPTIVLV